MMGVLRGPLIRKLFASPSSLFYVYSSLLRLLGLFVNYFFGAREGDRVGGDEFEQEEDEGEQCEHEEDISPKLFFSFKYQTFRGDSNQFVIRDECMVDFMSKESKSAGETLVEHSQGLQDECDATSSREMVKESEESNDFKEHESDIAGEHVEKNSESEIGELIQVKENASKVIDEEEERGLLEDEISESAIDEEEEESIPMRERASEIIEEEEEHVLLEDRISESEMEESILKREKASEIIAEESWSDSDEDPDLRNDFFAPNSDEFLSENDFGGEMGEELDPFDSEEDSSDILWEQQEFMEQLKMDMKRARTSGLPTIEEDDEYPDANDVFTPMKINSSFRHEYRISELRKFYRIYRQRMRKLDILNFQKRIAFRCLQSRLVHEDANGRGLRPIRRRRVSDSDSAWNAIGEVLEEFEKIYVAHTCLSWEMLHWQYIKMVELWETDKLRIQSYNEAAKEYQLFQVLLERFLENEAFDGPRIENYTSKRSSSQKLLQIPVIREDRAKERSMGVDAIKSDELIEIMEGAIRTMWRFIKADTSGREWGRSDDPLIAVTRSTLAKKEKRLKEVVNSGSSWMVWKRQKESREDAAYFFAEVEMKLVGRVLRMQKVSREQVEWCISKLDNIHFVGKKMQFNSSFSLFPC